jgi:hypothetical protein
MAYDGKGSETIEDNIYNTAYIVFYITHAHVQQNLLYLYSFAYSLHNDGYVGAKTFRRHIVNDKLLFIIDCAVCWFKDSIFNLRVLHGIWIPIN